VTDEPIGGGPLAGIRVVELASWVMAPACGAVLASSGADVIKIEPAGSADPSRATRFEIDGATFEPGFELANSGKRGIQLDLASEAGREVIHRLLERADVFLTNVRGPSLERAGIDAEALHERYRSLVIAHATGYGPEGPQAGRPAFDELAYWSRGGLAHALKTDDDDPVQLAGAMGDMPSAITLVAGIVTALFRRERDPEGRGAIVDVSLYSGGMWANGWLLQQTLIGAPERPNRGRLYRFNPLYTAYRCADGAWVQFAMFQTDRFWAPVCEAVERPDLIGDERFNTHRGRIDNNVAAIDELQRAIAKLPSDELGRRLDAADLPWSPIFTLDDVAADEQARVNDYIVPKRDRAGNEIDAIAPPFRLRDERLHIGPAPEVGQHLEEVLLEHGYDWDEITSLRERGAF
jgi:crotonobetainyl-CoA:carnitine CoA-transferase CaiB-like acyl-CoA transferase